MTIVWLDEAITKALRRGPKTTPQLVELLCVHRQTLNGALHRMTRGGVVMRHRESGKRLVVWELVR